jgi:hypothetical protein
MALEQSVVFRQLEQGSRFSRFDYFDAILVLLPYNIHALVELITVGTTFRPWITLVCAAIFVWFLRMRFPEGFSPLLRYLLTPKHLTPLAPDSILKPYPPASEAGEGRGAA